MHDARLLLTAALDCAAQDAMQKKASELKSKLADPAFSREMCKAGNADLVTLCNIETQVRERRVSSWPVLCSGVECCACRSALYLPASYELKPARQTNIDYKILLLTNALPTSTVDVIYKRSWQIPHLDTLGVVSREKEQNCSVP